MVGLTSWQALKERAGLSSGQKVFIPAGSGGIGTFAIQLARYFGARVGTTTSTGNVQLVSSLGADEVVDYRQQAFETRLQGYDVVLGTIRGDALEKSIGILKPGGKIVSLIGPLDAAFARAKRLNFVLEWVFGLMSRRITRLAKNPASATPSTLCGLMVPSSVKSAICCGPDASGRSSTRCFRLLRHRKPLPTLPRGGPKARWWCGSDKA
jgi:NADPH:quinone reductase-like Zn-dependent oxidoreductase